MLPHSPVGTRSVTQSCPTPWTLRTAPSRLLHPWNFPGKNTGVYLLCDSGNSNLGSVTTWRERWEEVGRRFKKAGTHVYLWLIHVDAWQK